MVLVPPRLSAASMASRREHTPSGVSQAVSPGVVRPSSAVGTTVKVVVAPAGSANPPTPSIPAMLAAASAAPA